MWKTKVTSRQPSLSLWKCMQQMTQLTILLHRSQVVWPSQNINLPLVILNPLVSMLWPQRKSRRILSTRSQFGQLILWVLHLRSLYHSLPLLHYIKVHVLLNHLLVVFLHLYHLVLYLVKLYLLLIHSVLQGPIRPQIPNYHSFLVQLPRTSLELTL